MHVDASTCAGHNLLNKYAVKQIMVRRIALFLPIFAVQTTKAKSNVIWFKISFFFFLFSY